MVPVPWSGCSDKKPLPPPTPGALPSQATQGLSLPALPPHCFLPLTGKVPASPSLSSAQVSSEAH